MCIIDKKGNNVKETKLMFKVWVTKYALTQGIFEEEVTFGSGTTEMVVTNHDNGCGNYYHGKGREWHETKASAVAKADEMRKAKIASMKKKIMKLEKLNFEAM